MRWFHVTGSGSYAYATTGGTISCPGGVPMLATPRLFSILEPCPSEDGCLLSVKITAVYADGGGEAIGPFEGPGTDINGPPNTGDGVFSLEYG